MKLLNLIFTVIFLISFQENTSSPQFAHSKEVAVVDKDFLLEYFKETGETLKESVEDLSEEQLQFKPSEETWSIGQCLEHIILTEQMLFENTKQMLQMQENPEKKDEITTTDQELIDMMVDRSFKAKASPDLQPQGKYAKPGIALEDLMEQREKIRQFIEDTPEDKMRNHFTDTPLGVVDGYQTLLFIAAHTSRHTAQIAEVMADPEFPEN